MRRSILAGLVLALLAPAAQAADSKAATATREKLKQEVTVDYKDTLLKDVVDDLQGQVKGLRFRLDTKGGVSQNRKITYKADKKPLEEVLDEIFKKEGFGYIVLSNEKDVQFDGAIHLKVGKERGFPEGQDAAKADKTEKKPAEKKPEPKKDEPKAKADPKKDEPKPRPVEDDDEKAERTAKLQLRNAKELAQEGKKEKAKEICQNILKKYPRTKAAEEAKTLLEKLEN